MTPAGWRFVLAVFAVLLSIAAVTWSLALIAEPWHRTAVVGLGGLAGLVTVAIAVGAWSAHRRR